MKIGIMNYSSMLKTVGLSILLFMALSYTSMASAAQGCGFGLHRSIYGGCILNYPGPGATPAPYHPGCWRNAWGALRCYR